MSREARPPAPAEIPECVADLTPAWITSALRSRGLLEHGGVEAVRTEILGEGEGFVGQIVRLHLDCGENADVPPSVIVKLPTQIEQNRILGEMLGSYEREIRFYEQFADSVSLRTPRCFYSAWDRNPLEGREVAVARFVDRLPGWLLRFVLPIFLWLGTRVRRRYVLVLEDLTDAEVGDQVAGCGEDLARRLVREMATLHAAHWRSPSFEQNDWLLDPTVMPNITQLMFRRNRDEFFSLFADRLTDAVPAIANWLDRRGVALLLHLGSHPLTILHGDFRLDNLFFRDPGRDDWLTAIDWQGAGIGRGPLDLAYFITGNVEPETRLAHETDLVDTYYDELVNRGVSGYSRAQCGRDYQLTKLFLLHRLIAGGNMIDLSHERGQQILDRMFVGLLETIPVDGLDALLDPAESD